MKVAIVGASGFVGTALARETLGRGHKVTAIARRPERIVVSGVTAVKADVMEKDTLSVVIRGHDAVLSAYNAGWTNPNIYSDFMTGSTNIEKAVEASGIKRYLVVGGAGSLEVSPGVQLVDTPEFPADYREGARAARDYLNMLRKNTLLDWTFLSPAVLMHAGITTGRTGRYRTGTDQPVFDENGESKISVEDLAVALVDELEQGNFLQRRFTVAY